MDIQANNNIITVTIPVLMWEIKLDLNIDEILGRK